MDGRSACKGDSGGPLFIKENQTRWGQGDLNLLLSFCLFCRNAVIGVVSFTGIEENAYACGSTPDVYARITPQAKSWIKSIATGAMDTKCE